MLWFYFLFTLNSIKKTIFVTNITKKMKGRPHIYKNKDLILKAQNVFWEKGYSATSLSDLSKATGAGAGSLYNTLKEERKNSLKKH